MEAKLVDELPDGPGWQFEPKWDGFRCLAFRNGGEVELRAKSGKPLARYFPEAVAQLLAVPADRFVLDGELAIPVGSNLSFDALQMRLHPAESRIQKLSRETPAILILFDMLMSPDGTRLIESPLLERRSALEALYGAVGPTPLLRLSPFTRKRSEAAAWLARAGGARRRFIAKRLDGPYQPANARC
jgi:ATP-dependent DNA ligase